MWHPWAITENQPGRQRCRMSIEVYLTMSGGHEFDPKPGKRVPTHDVIRSAFLVSRANDVEIRLGGRA